MAMLRGKTGPLLRLLELCWQIHFYPFYFGLRQLTLLDMSKIECFQDKFDAEKVGEEINQQYVLFPVWFSGFTNPRNYDEDATFDGKEHDFDAKKPESEVILSPSNNAQSRKQDDKTKKEAKGKIFIVGQNTSSNTNPFSVAGPSNTTASPTYRKSSFIDASQLFDDPDMPELEDITYSDDENVGLETDFNNLETSIIVSPILTTRIHKDHPDEKGIVVRNKVRLVAQRHTHEEGINYEEVFAPVARIEAIRLFLAYTSFIGFMVYQMDVKSAFLDGTIEEEVYVSQPLGFEDPDHPDKIYKVVKALYGLHQAPRAWYETLTNYLLENGFQRGKIYQTLFIKKQKRDILLVKQKKDGIFISQDKYVAEILRKFRLTEGKSASTPIDTEKPLQKDPDGEDVDVHIYSDYADASLDRKSTSGGCQFLGCRLISWQCKKQTIVATSSTEAEYVAAASCCA
nr:hypothetical protein [Tanacetum cinerariifolium]